MSRPKFDATNPDLSIVRNIVFQRLRQQSDWKNLTDDRSFEQFVEFSPPRPDDLAVFMLCVIDVMWDLVRQGILTPGINAGSYNINFPWFHLTPYGRKVIAQGEYVPNDPTGYLARLSTRIRPTDATVVAYLSEALDTFNKGSAVASVVMLGVAAERVFDLVCESMLGALKSPKEKKALEAHLARVRIRPRLEFVQRKFANLQGSRAAGFPESATLMVTAMYDMMRAQRNELGHPQEVPPKTDRQDTHARLQIFGAYYEIAEQTRQYLSSHQI